MSVTSKIRHHFAAAALTWREEKRGDALRLTITQSLIAFAAGCILDRELGKDGAYLAAWHVYRVMCLVGSVVGTAAGALGTAAFALGGIWLSGRIIGELIVLTLR